MCSPRKSVNDQSDPNAFHEEAASNNEQECQSEAQVTEYSDKLGVRILTVIHF